MFFEHYLVYILISGYVRWSRPMLWLLVSVKLHVSLTIVSRYRDLPGVCLCSGLTSTRTYTDIRNPNLSDMFNPCAEFITMDSVVELFADLNKF